MSSVKILLDGKGLDCSETPFFHGMKDGDLIDVITDSEGRIGAIWGRDLVESAEMCLDINWGEDANGICGTVASNHTLSSLGYETALRRNFFRGDLLREFLEANKRTDKSSTARIKVFRCHIHPNLRVEDFCEMNAVMHRVLAWIGRALSETDEERTYLTPPPSPALRLDAIFRILRAMPMLCGF